MTTTTKKKYGLPTTRLIKRYWDYLVAADSRDVEALNRCDAQWSADGEEWEEPKWIEEVDDVTDVILDEVGHLWGWIGDQSRLNTTWEPVPNGKGGFRRERLAVERPHHELIIDAVILRYGIDAVLDRLSQHQALS